MEYGGVSAAHVAGGFLPQNMQLCHTARLPSFEIDFIFQCKVVEYDVYDGANRVRRRSTPVSPVKISIFRRALCNYCLFSSPL